MAVTGTAAADETGTTGKVDVFIGDSSATNCGCTPDVKATDRWTRLLADADGVDELSVAVGGTGFIVGGGNTFRKQLDRALAGLKDRGLSVKDVNRVFVVGGGNDFSANDNAALLESYVTTLADVSKAFPGVQKVYMPEAMPMRENGTAGYESFIGYSDTVLGISKSYGFVTPDDWYQVLPFPEDHGSAGWNYTHANVKGHNIVAHAVADWVDSLDGPKTVRDIPAYRDHDGNGDDTVYVRFDANGGYADETKAGVSKPLAAKPGTNADLPGAGMYKRHGYTFAGWNTKRDGTGQGVAADAIHGWTVPDDKDGSVLLFAQWKRTGSAVKAAADVTLGDSTASFVDGSGVDAGNRWSALVSDADGVKDVNLAVPGSGFITGGDDMLQGQLGRSSAALSSSGLAAGSVKRVFVTGGANDLKGMLSGSGDTASMTEDVQKLMSAVPATFRAIADSYPDSQLVYIPEVAASNDRTDALNGKSGLYSDVAMQVASHYGFTVKRDWFGIAGKDDGSLTTADGMHLNAAGNAKAATGIIDWLKTTAGPAFPVRHHVSYDPNGGTGNVPASTTDADGSVTVPDGSTLERDGYTFSGWNTKADGTGTAYGAGDRMTVTSDARLFAQWSKTDSGTDGNTNTNGNGGGNGQGDGNTDGQTGGHGWNGLIGFINGIIHWILGWFHR